MGLLAKLRNLQSSATPAEASPQREAPMLDPRQAPETGAFHADLNGQGSIKDYKFKDVTMMTFHGHDPKGHRITRRTLGADMEMTRANEEGATSTVSQAMTLKDLRISGHPDLGKATDAVMDYYNNKMQVAPNAQASGVADPALEGRAVASMSRQNFMTPS